MYETIEGEIEHLESVARQARERYDDLTRDAIPGFNPAWGGPRFTKELHNQGYTLKSRARGKGLIYENLATGEQVRIMERPRRRKRPDPDGKHIFRKYYRYQPRNGSWGAPIPIPDKD
jgi:hypothetical protein